MAPPTDEWSRHHVSTKPQFRVTARGSRNRKIRIVLLL
jgi:hypothetical protein